VAERPELGGDAWRAAGGVLALQAADELEQVPADRRATRGVTLHSAAPEPAAVLAVPATTSRRVMFA